MGEIIAAKLDFGIEHYGIATGTETVISASKRAGYVAEESESVFSGGHPIISKGYPSDLSPFEVLLKARNALGKEWNFFDYNCQHFATECHGKKHSPQIREAYIHLGIVCLSVFLVRKKIIPA